MSEFYQNWVYYYSCKLILSAYELFNNRSYMVKLIDWPSIQKWPINSIFIKLSRAIYVLSSFNYFSYYSHPSFLVKGIWGELETSLLLVKLIIALFLIYTIQCNFLSWKFFNDNGNYNASEAFNVLSQKFTALFWLKIENHDE